MKAEPISHCAEVLGESKLKKKLIYRVAALYSVVAWVVLQIADVVQEPLGLPEWFMTTLIALIAGGFLIALGIAWLIQPGQETSESPSQVLSLESILLIIVVAALGWLIITDISQSDSKPSSLNSSSGIGRPVVVLMDTFAPRGVYDEETRQRSGTNADVLSEVLGDLEIITQKETLGSNWDRESQVLEQNPSLVLIHRSAFFHSMAKDLEVKYPTATEQPSVVFNKHYEIAENKLVAFLGYIADQNPNTRFVVYSRGTGGGWADEDYRKNWLRKVESRFQSLKGRVRPIPVPGGVAKGSWQSPEGRRVIRALVKQMLRSKEEQISK